jgi:hypothetical protein
VITAYLGSAAETAKETLEAAAEGPA